ncbi:hypothetical protein VSDG_05748 [Cytospora chrysosperma]|uniref:C2H2-type domain-containing protein n=1 Tax=Cytospora chrysosperma TaxID=252740 RepID=A0A423VTC0_CYTCH|nr:hypothetical protein VSDG_05748 [Valsa sordida]
MYSTCQAGSCSSSATKLKTINEVDAFDGDGWGTRRTSGLPTLRNALALDCYSLAKKSRYEPPFHPASSDFPVITPGTLTAPDIATGDYEAGINSTEETVPQSPGVAIFWDLDNTRLSKAQPFEVAQRLRQVIQDKYGPVKAMTAYANKATLDFVPRWAVDEAIAVHRATLLYERENEPAEPYRCGICGQKSKTLKKLQMHVKMMHERERRKKLNHVMSKKKDSKKRQRLQARHGSYLEKYRATVGGLVPNLNYSIDEELTRAMVDVRRVGDRREAADEALKAHASRLCFPRTQDGALENPFTCLVLVSDDSGFKKLLVKAKRAGIKAVQLWRGSVYMLLILTAAARDTQYTYGTSVTGITRQLAFDRTPALYTGNFGDCLGGQSLFNITKFDAAYYTDNSSVLFHLDGTSNIEHEPLMMRFSMNAYGENRFQMIFNPCSVNIYSLCPLKANVPVTAWAVFAVGPAQVGSIPQLAFTIPDFEGFVRMQMFANSTGAEVGCFQASLTNGVTLGHPRAIGPVLVILALVAVLASFATAAYGVILALLRTLNMAFGMMLTLAFYQFSFGGSSGVRAMAAIFFLLFLFGIGGLAIHACHSRLKHGRYVVRQDRLYFEAKVPDDLIGSLPCIRIHYQDDDPTRIDVHQDQAYVKRFGWLSARYRRSRWWFFGCYLAYQVIRAAFVGGATATPLAQVYGLLTCEVLSFALLVKFDPFEGQRNTALAVWILGLSKIMTTGLSVAFLPTLKLNRMTATGIGFIIVTVQGLLVFGLMILVVLGAISSYMSLTRNREDFSPEELESTRVRYFEHLQARALDVHIPREGKERRKMLEEAPKDVPPFQPSFSVKAVKRMAKIEDEDEDMVGVLDGRFGNSIFLDPGRVSRMSQHNRTSSACSHPSTHSLPRAATPHRLSWSSRNLADWDALPLQRPDSGLAQRLSGMSGYDLPLGNPLNAVMAPYIVEEEPVRLKSMVALAESSIPTTPTRSDSSSITTAVQTPVESSGAPNSSTERLSRDDK